MSKKKVDFYPEERYINTMPMFTIEDLVENYVEEYESLMEEELNEQSSNPYDDILTTITINIDADNGTQISVPIDEFLQNYTVEILEHIVETIENDKDCDTDVPATLPNLEKRKGMKYVLDILKYVIKDHKNDMW